MLRKNELAVINGVLNGTKNPNAKCNADILSRAHVAVTLEAILDEAGLTDEKLTKRLKQIVNRKAEQLKHGSNQTTVDNNALAAIRTIWQAKGNFTEKHEHNVTSNLQNMTDEQLDTIIGQGNRFLKRNKNTLN